MSGSLSRKASNPRRTTSWSSTTSTPMVSSIRGPNRSDGDPHTHCRPDPHRAPDREPRADLGGAAVHRLQAEVPRVSCGWIEAAPVVADLHDDLLLLRL